MAGVWTDLTRMLGRLEAIAEEPETRLDESVDELPSLQYALHSASELVVGIHPPPGAETAHAELAAALADARDATAEVLDAAETGGTETAALLVHEWRGALFRVRLARHRLAARPDPALPTAPDERRVAPAALAATLLVITGVAAFTGGAVLGFWQLWAAGLALLAGGFFAYRP
jgi:hypothetical protein